MKQRGFSVLELIVVAAIIGILISIGVPRFMLARTAAQESAATSELRNITQAETTYAAAFGGFYSSDLRSLGSGFCYAPDPSPANACLLDGSLLVPKNNYGFGVIGTNPMLDPNQLQPIGRPMGYQSSAWSIKPANGQRSFCSDETGIVKYAPFSIGLTVGVCADLAMVPGISGVLGN